MGEYEMISGTRDIALNFFIFDLFLMFNFRYLMFSFGQTLKYAGEMLCRIIDRWKVVSFEFVVFLIFYFLLIFSLRSYYAECFVISFLFFKFIS